MIEERTARIAALVDVLRPWDRNDPPMGDALATWAAMLDFVYQVAATEAAVVRSKRSGAARRRSVKTPSRGETLAEIRPPPPDEPLATLRVQDSPHTFGDVPWEFEGLKDRRPAKYAADRAVDAAMAAFQRLTGIEATRRNRQADTGRTNEPTVRSGPALAFAEALDGFYGVTLATDLRIAEAISRLLEMAQHRLTYGAQ